MSWLRALSTGCRCWCCGPGCWRYELAERADGWRRWSGAGAAADVVSWQSAPVPVSADRARCGGAVSRLCRLRAFLLQPVACQQVPHYLNLCWCNLILCEAETTAVELETENWRLCNTTLVRGVSAELEDENWRLCSTTLVRGAICGAGS